MKMKLIGPKKPSQIFFNSPAPHCEIAIWNPNPRIRLSVRPCHEKTPTANTLSNGKHAIQRLTHYPINDPWVTRPERPKGAMDEVKRPEGPSARSRGLEGP